MSQHDLDLRLNVAEAVIRHTGDVAARYYAERGRLAIEHKGLQDLVSEADRECEKLIIAGLSKAFPEDGFLGEEGGWVNKGAAATWVIDPIDGTRNFLAGVPFWCVSIGLVMNGEAVLGLIYHPATGELFSAVRGGGSFVNGERMAVSGETKATRARLCVGFSRRSPIGDHVSSLEALLNGGCDYCRIGSGALGLAYTAAGRFDGFWERHLNSWDAAAGLVLVSEAGGWINDFLAGDGLENGREILAATPGLVADFKRFTGFVG